MVDWSDRDIETAIEAMISITKLGYSAANPEAVKEFVKGKDVSISMPTWKWKVPLLLSVACVGLFAHRCLFLLS